MKICGLDKIKCLSYDIYRYMSLQRMSVSFETSDPTPYRCNCLPRCNSVSYSKLALSRIASQHEDKDVEEEMGLNEEMGKTLNKTGEERL